MGIVQVHEGIVQNHKHTLFLKQCIHQCQTQAQHHKVRLSRAEIGKLPRLSHPLRIYLKIRIDQILFPGGMLQLCQIPTETTADDVQIACRKPLPRLLQKGHGIIQNPDLFPILHHFVLQLRQLLPKRGNLLGLGAQVLHLLFLPQQCFRQADVCIAQPLFLLPQRPLFL